MLLFFAKDKNLNQILSYSLNFYLFCNSQSSMNLKFPMTENPYLALEKATFILFDILVNPSLSSLLLLTNDSKIISDSSP